MGPSDAVFRDFWSLSFYGGRSDAKRTIYRNLPPLLDEIDEKALCNPQPETLGRDRLIFSKRGAEPRERLTVLSAVDNLAREAHQFALLLADTRFEAYPGHISR
jgi:hypothetical protein